MHPGDLVKKKAAWWGDSKSYGLVIDTWEEVDDTGTEYEDKIIVRVSWSFGRILEHYEDEIESLKEVKNEL